MGWTNHSWPRAEWQLPATFACHWNGPPARVVTTVCPRTRLLATGRVRGRFLPHSEWWGAVVSATRTRRSRLLATRSSSTDPQVPYAAAHSQCLTGGLDE